MIGVSSEQILGEWQTLDCDVIENTFIEEKIDYCDTCSKEKTEKVV